MATDIVIPSVGESVTSGVISSWLKSEGEWADRDEPVLELETDKITMEVPAPAAGAVKHGAKEGQEVQVGATVGQIDESAQKPSGKDKESAEQQQAPAKESRERAESGKEDSGKQRGPSTATKAPPPEPPSGGGPADSGPSSNGPVRATPLARKIAQEHGVDLSAIHGTGAGSRVREQDVLAFVQSRGAGQPAAPAAPRRSERTRMSPLRQRIATRLVEAQQTAAMLTTFNECDMSAVLALRKAYKEDFEKKHGVGLGFMGFFVKAAVNALRAYPMVNALIVQDERGQPAIQTHEYCDIAVAVSTPKGLVVPVLRDCQALSFAQVESGIKDLAGRARDGKLTLDEMQGGTFTVTNGGVFGSLLSTPILNPPQSAILGMHKITNRPVEDPDNPGQVALRPMMYLALSYDHRIIDGAEAVRFLVKVKEGIEDPQRLLLDL